jgi:hypothetical protein
MRVIIAALAILLCSSATALGNEDVEALLASTEAPHGVVFEIVEADETALEDLLPEVRDAIRKIRARFPDTEFAVVSHGREEFALQTVHVCETHAGWYGVTAEDFPDYVNVAPTGPGQVQLYEELGYELIVVD